MFYPPKGDDTSSITSMMEDPLKDTNRFLMVLLLLLAAVLAGCENPTSSNSSGSGAANPDECLDCSPPGGDTAGGGDSGGTGTGGGSDGTSGDGGTDGGAGDVPPSPITITFVLDMDAGEGMMLSTSHSAPAPLAATVGVPVRLNQGIGFTATGPGPGGEITYHASGWSKEPYSTQFGKIVDSEGPAPSGDGYYLPGFEATFTEDTTLYTRWLPEYDTVAARITYQAPSGTGTVLGPILHLRDQLPFESMVQFQDRISPPWSVDNNQRVFEWKSKNNAFERTAINASAGEPAVWQFDFNNGTAFLNATPALGLREITVTYESRLVHNVTFNYNGAPPVAGNLAREAFDGEQLQAHRTWWGMADPPVWNDYSFNGWYTDSGFTTDWYANATDDVTLVARWMATVTFNPNGGLISGSSAGFSDDFDVDESGTIEPIADPTTLHDTWDVFVGWFADSSLNTPVTLVDGRLSVTGGETIYAGWGPKYAVDDVGPGGGRIFHVADAGGWPRASTSATAFPFNGWKFLEVAPGNADGVFSWSTPTMPNTRFTAESHDSLGGGTLSTNDIISVHTHPNDPTAGYAPYVVREDYTSNGLSDWYLPSVVELNEIATSGVWGTVGMGSQVYWSSSSYANPDYSADSMGTRAFTVQLSSGTPAIGTVGRGSGGSTLRARPVRRF